MDANRKSMVSTGGTRMTGEENDDGDGPSGLVSFALPEDEMDVPPRGKRNEHLRLTRSEVLFYFTEELDGYRCNICNHVSPFLVQL